MFLLTDLVSKGPVGIRVRLLYHNHNRQALGPSILSPHVPELCHHPQLQSRPLQPCRCERHLGTRYLHRLYFRVRSDHSILGPDELWPVYRHEGFLAVHGYIKSFHGYRDIDIANLCGMEASDQEVTEGCYIGNLSFGRLVRSRPPRPPALLPLKKTDKSLRACSVCLSSIVRTCFMGKVDIDDPTCMFPISSGLYF